MKYSGLQMLLHSKCYNTSKIGRETLITLTFKKWNPKEIAVLHRCDLSSVFNLYLLLPSSVLYCRPLSLALCSVTIICWHPPSSVVILHCHNIPSSILCPLSVYSISLLSWHPPLPFSVLCQNPLCSVANLHCQPLVDVSGVNDPKTLGVLSDNLGPEETWAQTTAAHECASRMMHMQPHIWTLLSNCFGTFLPCFCGFDHFATALNHSS